MSALAVTNPNLLDLVKRMDPDGKVTNYIAEVLTQINPVLDHMSWREGNLPTGNRTTIRTGLPSVTWRQLYGGVQPSKSRTAQVTDNCGMLEAYAEVDKALADLNGNTQAFRMTEDKAFIDAMSQELAQTLFYGNEGTEPEAFTGLSARYNLSTADNGDNVIKAGSADTDNQSIWLIVWGDHIHGIVPKGSKAGLQMKDMGEVTVEDASGGSNTGRMQAYRSHYRWDAGLTVRDWRYAVRICNIEKSALTKDAASGPDLADLLFQAVDRVPNMQAGRPALYMSRGVLSFLRRQLANKTKDSTLTIDNVGGKRVTAWQGIPVNRVDALGADEALVS